MSLLDRKPYGSVGVVFRPIGQGCQELVKWRDWFSCDHFAVPGTSGWYPTARACVHSAGRVVLRLQMYRRSTSRNEGGRFDFVPFPRRFVGEPCVWIAENQMVLCYVKSSLLILNFYRMIIQLFSALALVDL